MSEMNYIIQYYFNYIFYYNNNNETYINEYELYDAIMRYNMSCYFYILKKK